MRRPHAGHQLRSLGGGDKPPTRAGLPKLASSKYAPPRSEKATFRRNLRGAEARAACPPARGSTKMNAK
eukprot:2754550-Pyramimonas_sp.AAC.1